MSLWADKLYKSQNFKKAERTILILSFNEYLNQLFGGIMMSQNEIIRPIDLDYKRVALEKLNCEDVLFFRDEIDVDYLRSQLIELIIRNEGTSFIGNDGLNEDQTMIRQEFYKFAKEKIEPFAHEWHLKDELIPLSVIEELADLGVFGLTIPEEFGGTGLDKITMCVVSEELSRGYIGVGSLATRTDIASELILCGGTEEQKKQWLPGLANGDILPTAVFTEPNTGSDLGALRTRAVKSENGNYQITGNKTWITHASRTHVMTLLARTDPETKDHRGLSMFLAEKQPGNDDNPFPDKEISGGEICLLQHEVDMIEVMVEKMMANDICRDLIQPVLGNVQYEEPGVVRLYDNMWKGKADIINHDEQLIIDLKTRLKLQQMCQSYFGDVQDIPVCSLT